MVHAVEAEVVVDEEGVTEIVEDLAVFEVVVVAEVFEEALEEEVSEEVIVEAVGIRAHASEHCFERGLCLQRQRARAARGVSAAR